MMAKDVAIAPQGDSALAKLSEKRQRFVLAYVARGRREAGKAYVEAGYQPGNANSARVNACLLLHRADVQLAIQEVCRRDLVALAPVANSVATELLQNPQIEPGVRARLVMGVWDRTGLAGVSEVKHTVEHIGNDPAEIGRVRTMIESLGLDQEQAVKLFGRTVARKALTAAPSTIEAEFVEVEDDPFALTEEEREMLRLLEESE